MCHCLIHVSKSYFPEKSWRLEKLHTLQATEKLEIPKISLHKNRKKKLKNPLFNWKTADRVEEGFSLYNRPEMTICLVDTVVIKRFRDNLVSWAY